MANSVPAIYAQAAIKLVQRPHSELRQLLREIDLPASLLESLLFRLKLHTDPELVASLRSEAQIGRKADLDASGARRTSAMDGAS